MSSNSEIIDATIQHSIYLEQYKAGEVQEIVDLLETEIITPISKKVLVSDIEKTRRATSRKLLKSIREIVDKGGTKYQKRMLQGAVDIAGLETRWLKKIVNAASKTLVNLDIPALPTLKALVTKTPMQGKYLADWSKNLEERTYKATERVLKSGIAVGRTNGEMIRELRGTKKNEYKDGVLNITRRDAEGIVRTAANQASSVARDETFQQNAELLQGWRFVATLDGRTTLICIANDGKVFPVDEGPRPPLHFNCRSTAVPVLKSWQQLGLKIKNLSVGQRASMDGTVPANMTYEQFLKNKGTEFQDNVLGPERAKLFRDNKLTVAQMVAPNGRTLTLKELEEKL